MFKIQTFNTISEKGLSRFETSGYQLSTGHSDPSAYILRSQKLHEQVFPESLLAIARAGAGTNNIPIDRCSDGGVVVFNTPGANANAVKELVLTGMLMGCRDISGGVSFCRDLKNMTDDAEMAQLLEKEKKHFAGQELQGKMLGVVGLGAIGAMIANAALDLGMNVVGYDPAISIEAAWRLSSHVEKMESLEMLMGRADFITLHVPAIEATHHLINAERLALCKKGTVLLNFARESIVNNAAVVDALNSGVLSKFVTDFPTAQLVVMDKVIPMPHIGASTAEAEENCAMMAADQLKDYLVNGNIKNSVNLPEANLARVGASRITFINKNVPKILGSVLSILAEGNINVMDMLNRSRGELAYNIIDVESALSSDIETKIAAVEGVLRVRVL